MDRYKELIEKYTGERKRIEELLAKERVELAEDKTKLAEMKAKKDSLDTQEYDLQIIQNILLESKKEFSKRKNRYIGLLLRMGISVILAPITVIVSGVILIILLGINVPLGLSLIIWATIKLLFDICLLSEQLEEAKNDAIYKSYSKRKQIRETEDLDNIRSRLNSIQAQQVALSYENSDLWRKYGAKEARIRSLEKLGVSINSFIETLFQRRAQSLFALDLPDELVANLNESFQAMENNSELIELNRQLESLVEMPLIREREKEE